MTFRKLLGVSSGNRLTRAAPFDDGKTALKASDTAGKETDDDLFVASTKTVKVGTVASPSSITKPLRITSAEVIPVGDTQLWSFFDGYLHAGSSTVVLIARAAVLVPKGITLTTVRARLYRNSTSDVASAILIRVADDGTVTTLATLTHSTTGWQTVSASLSQLVGDEVYFLSISLDPNTNGTHVRFNWAEFDYTMPSYDKGI